MAITTCIFIGLQIVGVENALLIAVFTGIVNLVPYLGPWIGASFGIFILVANNIDASFVDVIEPKIIGMLIVFATTQLIDNYLFQPAIFSNSINANPLEIFVVILVAGSLGGVTGMIAAIPVYSFIRIVFKEMNKEFRWLQRIKER
jgi:predicted PurR-regulated permease PerM